MFIFGHLGIGSKLVSPFSKDLPLKAVLLGTLLPDIIDKPLFIFYKSLTGQALDSGGIISGTKTFGHTAALTLLLMGLAVSRKNKWLAALVLGSASHIVLDMLFENFRGTWTPELLNTLFWPFLGWNFYIFKLESASDYLNGMLSPPILVTELLGALILGWETWKGKRRGEMLAMIGKGRKILAKARKFHRRRENR